MTTSVAEPSVASDGNFRLWFVPGLDSNPLSVAILNAATTKDITYSMTPSGYNHTINQNSVDDSRLTKVKNFSRNGTSTETLELQYVAAYTEDDIARLALAQNAEGWLVERRGVPDETPATVGDLVTAIPIQAGRQRPDAPAANAVFSITQAMAITGDSHEDEPLVA